MQNALNAIANSAVSGRPCQTSVFQGLHFTRRTRIENDPSFAAGGLTGRFRPVSRSAPVLIPAPPWPLCPRTPERRRQARAEVVPCLGIRRRIQRCQRRALECRHLLIRVFFTATRRKAVAIADLTERNISQLQPVKSDTL